VDVEETRCGGVDWIKLAQDRSKLRAVVNTIREVIFEVLTAASMKMAVFWVGKFTNVSETSVNFYHSTWSNNPEDGHIQVKFREVRIP
jgi:hypothetical protein